MTAPDKIYAWPSSTKPQGVSLAGGKVDDQIEYTRSDLSQASVAAALEAAAQEVDTAGDSAVTEALGQSLCCSGYHCGCQGADVGAYLMHHIRALITPDQHDALAAHVAAEVAKALAVEAAKIAQLEQDLADANSGAGDAYRRGYWEGGNGA